MKMIKFQFLVVRLKGACRNDSRKLSVFQFLVVRLKENIWNVMMFTKVFQFLVVRLKDTPVDVMATFVDGEVVVSRGVMEGMIGYEIQGENGFGYDPIFYLPEYHATSAQISPEIKNKISHRGKALELMKLEIKKRLKQAFS